MSLELNDPYFPMDLASAKSASQACKGTMQEKLLAAMLAVRESTMESFGRENFMLHAAVVGVMEDLGKEHPDSQQLIVEMKVFNKFNEMLQSNGTVSLMDVVGSPEHREMEKIPAGKQTPILAMWRRTKVMNSWQWKETQRKAENFLDACKKHNLKPQDFLPAETPQVNDNVKAA